VGVGQELDRPGTQEHPTLVARAEDVEHVSIVRP
jgi:hypothetical protein